MWLRRKKRASDQVRDLSAAGVLNEQTFWQIVRTEKERADRSGMPLTIAIFTVNQNADGQQSVNGCNAAALCNALRKIARLTDHVGMAGENELGVVLWGTRELGAYRYVNRLGEQGEQLSSDCRLFVYPTLSCRPRRPAGATEQPGDTIDGILDRVGQGGSQILDRIADVEEKLARALTVETPVVKEEDFDDHDESLSFGNDDDDDDDFTAPTPPVTFSATTGSANSVRPESDRGGSGGVATMAIPSKVSQPAVQPQSAIQAAEATARARQLSIVMEPLENLFVFPHPPWKRAIDVVGSICGLVFLSPILLAVAALIKITSPGPAMFKQLREGHGGKLFTIYKFRTMRVGADAEKATLQAHSEQDGPAFKMTHDPRITPIGGFLRKTCLDELPQLWNVVKGDMTLVGPRPLDYRESEKIARWGRRRMHVMPGLTCIWQVHGKSKVSFNEWMRMDIRYSQRVGFWSDIKLVMETLKQVLLRKASN